MENSEVYAVICISILLTAPVIVSQQIPADKGQVNAWFGGIIKPVKERGNSLDPELIQAESNPKVITVRQGGGGEFNSVKKAIESVALGNTKRVIISIGPGVYKEKIKIERGKPFITLLGDPKNMPNLTFGGTAKEYGTVNSATLIAESNYFVAANLNIVNSAPKPVSGKTVGGQAVALRVSGDRSAIYNCNIYGFQDTLCDDKGNHFFKDCYVSGTVDFIFGSGKSLYLNTDIFVEKRERGGFTVITAQARESSSEDTGYSFVHGSITGTASNSFLGRAWRSNPRVVFAYTDMSNVVNPAGWTHNRFPERAKTVYYGEYKCKGPGANPSKREPFVKQLSGAEALPFLGLNFIEATKWLLPPPKY
ncbi:hypothetical protein Goshw_000091 [Gossypium schwendimanii]|uniref:Pectinesterase n=1 Tax=Gossypium schwendimanii TaxID=34291 RepID=A0A7J9LSS2_GOSSC|nr:hypothetical protein [Gossypium schwendimanii]